VHGRPTAERILALLQEDINWDYPNSALAWGDAALYWSLNATCPEAAQAIMGQLRDYFHSLARRNLFLTRELLILLNLFRAHQIPAITKDLYWLLQPTVT